MACDDDIQPQVATRTDTALMSATTTRSRVLATGSPRDDEARVGRAPLVDGRWMTKVNGGGKRRSGSSTGPEVGGPTRPGFRSGHRRLRARVPRRGGARLSGD